MSREHEQAHAMIMARIREPRRRLTPLLAALEPLEAISLLGALVDDTIARWPPDERAAILAEFCAELLDNPDA